MYRDLAQWVRIRERVLTDGVSQRQIQRETGISRMTISKMIAHPIPPRRAPRPPSRPKLGPYIPSIRQLMRKNEMLPPLARLNGKAIWEHVRKEGFSGSYSAVRDFVRSNQRLSHHDDSRTWKRDAARVSKSVSDLLVSLSGEQAKDLLCLLLKAGPQMVSAAKVERLIRIAASQADAAAKPNSREVKRKDAWEWMHGVLHGLVSAQDIERDHPDLPELRPLLRLVVEGRLSARNKALAVLANRRGIPGRVACDFLNIHKHSYWKYVRTFKQGGVDALFARKASGVRKFDDEETKKAVFSTLHEPPSNYGINRTTWKMYDLTRVLRENGHAASKGVVRKIIRDAGYRWRKARTVLTSKDPEYRAKLNYIQYILSNLQEDEAFFSIDEFGPFAVKMRGGRALAAPGEQRVVPQWQESKGRLILTAALELSGNQVAHFYSEKKNTAEMIRMAELLVKDCTHRRKIYLSWDAASWHMSKRLNEWISNHNATVPSAGGPVVETAPLPAGAQFLNVIESVFSGMAQAIIHNSNYASVDEAKDAIDRYFADRNANFRLNPQRAGKKIWGEEREQPAFSDANNCKDPLYR